MDQWRRSWCIMLVAATVVVKVSLKVTKAVGSALLLASPCKYRIVTEQTGNASKQLLALYPAMQTSCQLCAKLDLAWVDHTGILDLNMIAFDKVPHDKVPH